MGGKTDLISGQLDLFSGQEVAAASEEARVPILPALHDENQALAARLPAGLRMGASSWSFPGWAGLVYDRKHSERRLAREGLAAYSSHPLFRTVGLDRTYYAPLEAEEYRAYLTGLPADFRFLAKAHEDCTVLQFPSHPRYGSRQGQVNPRFLDAGYAAERVVGPLLEGLGERLGVLLFQFSAQSVKSLGGPLGFAQKLHTFFEALPGGVTYAVELRDPRLLTVGYLQVLHRLELCHCVNVHPSMPGPGVQALRTELVENTPLLVVRWILGGGLGYGKARDLYEPYDQLAAEDPSSRCAIAELCQEMLAAGREAYVIVNNKAEGCAPLSIVKLAQQFLAD